MTSGMKLITHQNGLLPIENPVKMVTSANRPGQHHKRGLIRHLRILANYLITKEIRH